MSRLTIYMISRKIIIKHVALKKVATTLFIQELTKTFKNTNKYCDM